MADAEQTQDRAEPDAEELKEEQGSAERDKAQQAEDKYEQAKEKMHELEEKDEPPTDLEDWPSDEAKYVTYGGPEGDHSYEEGPEKKLGPSSLERKPDGSVLIDGEEVDNPDEYRADPVPGGPTDKNTADLPGEIRKREALESKGTLPEEYKDGVPDRGSSERDEGEGESEGEGEGEKENEG
jgi:hypothetical protein